MAQAARRALLIGAGRAPQTEGTLESLEAPVEADLRLMEATLRASGYEVAVLHDAQRGATRVTIDRIAREMPPGGTLLLYFTGHGLRVDGACPTDLDGDAVPFANQLYNGPPRKPG